MKTSAIHHWLALKSCPAQRPALLEPLVVFERKHKETRYKLKKTSGSSSSCDSCGHMQPIRHDCIAAQTQIFTYNPNCFFMCAKHSWSSSRARSPAKPLHFRRRCLAADRYRRSLRHKLSSLPSTSVPCFHISSMVAPNVPISLDGDSNEKAKNHGTHLSGRRDSDLR